MLYYEEIFKSLQGESRDSGIPCVFIRLFGCPIGCVYCDQIQDKKDRKKISIERIVSKVRKLDCNYVCITGGEPLIQDDTLPLVYELLSLGYKVSIETSGCVPIDDCNYIRSYRYVMDVKCPSSGVSKKNIYDNLLKLQDKDEVKYVVGNRTDYDFMKHIMKSYPTSAKVLVSPLFTSDNHIAEGCKGLTKWILEDNLDVRVQVQLHKILGCK